MTMSLCDYEYSWLRVIQDKMPPEAKIILIRLIVIWGKIGTILSLAKHNKNVTFSIFLQ